MSMSLTDRAFESYKNITAHRGTSAPKSSDSFIYKSRGELFSTIAYAFAFLEDVVGFTKYNSSKSILKRMVMTGKEKEQAVYQGSLTIDNLKLMSQAINSGNNAAFDFRYKINNSTKSLDVIITNKHVVTIPFDRFKNDILPHLQKYFMKAKVGETAKRVGSGFDATIIPDISFDSPGFKPFSTLRSLAVAPKTEDNHMTDHNGTIPVPMMESDKKIWNILSYSISFASSRLSVTRYDPRNTETLENDEEEKTYPINPNDNIHFSYELDIKVSVPAQDAMWLNYADRLKDVSIPDINMIMANYLKEQIGKVAKDDKIVRIMPITKGVDSLKEKISKSVVKIAPRVFKNMTVLGSGAGSGTFIFVPPVGEVEEFVKEYNDTYDAESGKVLPTSSFNNLKNKFLLADWYHNALVYSNAEGRINTLDLAGSMAPTRALLYRELDKQYASNTIGDVNTFVSVTESLCNSFDIDVKIKQDTGINDTIFQHSSFSQITTYIIKEQINYDIQTKDLFNVSNPRWDEIIKENEVSPLMATAVRYFIEVCRSCLAYCNKGMYGGSAFSRIIAVYKSYVIFGDLCYNYKNFERAEKEYQEERKKNLPTFYSFKERLSKSITVPNMPGLAKTGLQPHQAQIVLGSLEKNPKYTILSVDAGGGKTALFLSQLMMGISQGHYKRGLIICPGGLKKSWVNEIFKYSEGRLNPFVLNKRTLGAKLPRLGLDTTEDYLKYLKALPPNTVFITDYDFLRSQGFNNDSVSSIQYSDKNFTFFPNAHFIIQLECDYVGIDESHRIKNLTSQRSTATKSVISYSKNRTLGSGTVLYNTANDIVGQVGCLNPGILSDIKSVMESDDYSQKQKTKYITDTMNPFVAYNTAKKRDWSFMIPKVNYSYIDASMTSNQREFYSDLIREELDKITKDPKVSKILESGDEDAIDKIIKSKLSTAFAPVEIFMNAPESNEYFVNKNDTTQKDLIPPKAPILNQVLQAHFKGGVVKSATGLETTFRASNSKAVVFCYNKAISKALFNHLDPNLKGMALHYDATAEGEKNLIRFQQDENIKILIADETSISEGHNLQMASHAIRIQALWTPGGEEQSLSRVYRPDHGNKYKRSEIYITTIICNSSLDIPKTARVMAKKISNMKVEEENRPDWKEFVSNNNIPDLPLISMNLKRLLEITSKLSDVAIDKPLLQDGERVSLVDYFSTYSKIITWDYKQGILLTAQLKEAIAEKLGKPVDQVTTQDMRDNSYTKVEGDSVLKGSKAVYVPFIPGISSMPDKMGLKLAALAIIEQQNDSDNSSNNEDDDGDNDDDNTDLIENTPYEIGDLVVTEYGFGFIATISEKQKNVVSVDIPGFVSKKSGIRTEKVITLNKSEVFKPLNEDLYNMIFKRLTKLKEQNKGLVFTEKPFTDWTLADVMNKNIKPPKPPKMVDLPKPNIKPADHPNAKPGTKDEPAPKTNIDDTGTGTSKPTTKPASKPTTTPVKPVVKPTRVVEDDTEDTMPTNNFIMSNTLSDKQKNNVVDNMTKNNLLFHYKPSTGVAALVDATVINGLIALTTYPAEGHFDKLEGASGKVWDIIPTFGYIEVNTLQGAKNLVERLETTFVIPEITGERILSLATSLKGKGRPTPVKQEGPLTLPALKNFIKVNHTDTMADDQLKVYPIIWNGLLVVAAIKRIQPQAFNQFIKLRVQGCKRAVVNMPSSAYLFFDNRNAAAKELTKINERIHVINYDDIIQELKTDPIYRNLVMR